MFKLVDVLCVVGACVFGAAYFGGYVSVNGSANLTPRGQQALQNGESTARDTAANALDSLEDKVREVK